MLSDRRRAKTGMRICLPETLSRSDVTSACSEPQINVSVALSVAYPFFFGRIIASNAGTKALKVFKLGHHPH